MPGLRPLLKELFLKKIPMGIISNAQFYTPLIFETLLHAPLAKLGFDSDLIFFSYQYQRAKPSKCLYEAAAQQLYIKKIEPNHVFFMGNDMLKDILPAHRIGFQTALFAGDARSLRLHRKDPKCYEKTAHVVVTDLTQLLKLIQIQQSP
jgi:putative hydrolase of the HAD superfamily